MLRTSDHLFFRLSDPRCVDFLNGWTTAPGRLQPQVANKAREWLAGEGESGARATGTSPAMRPTSAFRFPDAPGKYFYVWLDAPIGYLASLQSYFASGKARANGEPRSFEEFLAAPDTEQIHFIGKDIIYFHTLFWPAMLKFAGPPYKVPDHVYVHGFITVSGEKMSKSRGTGISPLRYLDIGMNPEWLRYYIAAKLNANVEDIDFNPEDFIARVNSDLVGKYVNIASRAANFITRHFDGALAYAGGREALRRQAARHRRSRCATATRRANSAAPCARSWRTPTASIRTSTRSQPWVLAKDPAQARRAAGHLLAHALWLQAAERAARARSARRRARASRASSSGSIGPSPGPMPWSRRCTSIPIST